MTVNEHILLTSNSQFKSKQLKKLQPEPHSWTFHMMVGTSVHNPTIRAGESNEQEDSWDVTSFVNNPKKLNSLELKIINNDNKSEKKTLTDNIYAIVSWTVSSTFIDDDDDDD